MRACFGAATLCKRLPITTVVWDLLLHLLLAEELQLGKSKARRKSKSRSRKTRGMLADEQKGPKSFAVMLEEVKHTLLLALHSNAHIDLQLFPQAELDQLPPEVPTYLTAAIGPSKIASARKWCSVCGNLSP